tara:strand:- start:824 stop:1237 length:414 start_codon:yes stop_codon:yes gene_type:complete
MRVRIGPYRKNQAKNIEIEPFDTWSMDYTLALIVYPMLVQLKDTTHGAPNVDDEDVPEELRSTNASPKDNEWDTDEYWFKRWDWVLDQMIYSFKYKADDVCLYLNFKPEEKEAMNNEQDRISNGFRLFGKYYENLWD